MARSTHLPPAALAALALIALTACDENPMGATPPGAGLLPVVHDLSGAPDERVEALIVEALDGLGLNAATGPSPLDRVIVGRQYMAWIDETGFVGKLNGLWALTGEGEALDFALRDGGRPVNQLVVGEHGRGGWPAGYPGAEHIEFPNRTPEPDDDPRCAERDWCNQYGVSEAAPITDRDIPWWSACNAGKPGFGRRFEAIDVVRSADDITLWYRAPLVKVADGDGRWDGDACHEDYLFADGIRRRVWLRLGWQFRADAPDFDRLLQVENPADNPPFDGPMSFIGGFVMTAWPDPHPLKGLDRFWRAERRDARISWGDREVLLPAGRWTDLRGEPVMRGRDALIAWAGQPLSFSDRAGYVAGRSFTLSHVGAVDNDDVGACLCAVHGGLELGGGLIHGGISLPVAPGASSPVARRRLSLRRDDGQPGGERVVRYEAEGPALRHAIGRAEADGWSANTADDAPGHMVFGPYARDWGERRAGVTFTLMVDVAQAADDEVVALEVFDADAEEMLGRRVVRRGEFGADFAWRDFTVEVDLAGRGGHAIETRVWWTDRSYVRVDAITVRLRD